MTDPDIDMAPPPEDTLQLVRLRCGGWNLLFDGETQAAFSDLFDMLKWMEQTLGPLERPELKHEPLPTMLEAAQAPHKPIWRIFSGGRS